MPTRKNRKNGEWVHWLVVNIPGSKIARGQVLVEYIGPGSYLKLKSGKIINSLKDV